MNSEEIARLAGVFRSTDMFLIHRPVIWQASPACNWIAETGDYKMAAGSKFTVIAEIKQKQFIIME